MQERVYSQIDPHPFLPFSFAMEPVGSKNPVCIAAQLRKSKPPIERQIGLLFPVCYHSQRRNLQRFLVFAGQRIHQEQRSGPEEALIARKPAQQHCG